MTTVDPALARRILELEMLGNEVGAETVREYLVEMLWLLWDEGEVFEVGRTFNASGWRHQVYKPLVDAGLLRGRLDPTSWRLEEVDEVHGKALIAAAIAELDPKS